MRMDRPGRPTRVPMMRGTRNEFSDLDPDDIEDGYTQGASPRVLMDATNSGLEGDADRCPGYRKDI